MSRTKKVEDRQTNAGFPVLGTVPVVKRVRAPRKTNVVAIATKKARAPRMAATLKPKVKIPKSVMIALAGAFDRLNKVAGFIKDNQ